MVKRNNALERNEGLDWIVARQEILSIRPERRNKRERRSGKTEENLHEILGDIYSVSYVEWMKMFSDWRAERWNTLIR